MTHRGALNRACRNETSVSLEDAFWRGLKDIATTREMTLSDLIGGIDITVSMAICRRLCGWRAQSLSSPSSVTGKFDQKKPRRGRPGLDRNARLLQQWLRGNGADNALLAGMLARRTMALRHHALRGAGTCNRNGEVSDDRQYGHPGGIPLGLQHPEDDVRASRLHTRAIARTAVVDADDGPAVQQLAKEITEAADKIEAARSELLLHCRRWS